MGDQILIALAPYLVPVLVAVLVPVVKYALDHLPTNVQPKVVEAVQHAVQAVEQVASTQMSSPAKKQMAIEIVMKELEAMHLSIPEPVISALIESAVYELKLFAAPQAVAVSAAPVVEQKGV